MRCRVCAEELAEGMSRCPRCGQPVHPATPYPHGNTTELPTVPPAANPYPNPYADPHAPPVGPPYPGSPSWPVSGAGAFPYPVQPRRRRPWLLLVVLLVVGATGVIGIGLAAASTISHHDAPPPSRGALPSGTTGTGSPASTGDTESGQAGAAAQAGAVNDLLTASGTSRATLATAIAQVQSCDPTADPLSTMDDVVRDRTAQVRQAQGLAVGALPGGESLRGVLVQLLQKSSEADGDYQAWAQQVLDSACAPGSGAAQLTAAGSASSEATTLKKAFLTAWNPIAARYGLPQRTEPDI